MKESLPVAVLKPNEERRIQRGHLWAYRNEFAQLPDLADGDLFDIYSSGRRFVGRAFFQFSGGIAGRVLSYHQQEIDKAFLKKKFDEALSLRSRLFPSSTAYRWVYGESDGLPGLVIDRYGSVLVAQSTCAFYLRRKKEMADLLLSKEVRTVVFAGETGMETLGEPLQAQEVQLDDLRVSVSLDASQKTGLFLDQRENWPVIRRFSRNASVLDGHCYHGLWGIHAALGGAASVLGVDTSESAVVQARTNAEINGVADRCVFEKGPVETVLDSGKTFDVIVLDPPAFAKTRGQASRALSRYQELNAKALAALNPEGILITCSCSHFMPRDMFLEALKRASRSASRPVQILGVRGAGPDHPVLPVMPETEYLKCVIVRAT